MKGRLLAKVGKVEVFESDVEGVRNALAPELQASYQGEEGQKRLLDEVIYQELFYLDALDRGMDKDPQFVARVEEVKRGMLRDMNISRNIAQVSVTDDEVRTFYNQNGEMLVQPEVRTSHILVSTEQEALRAKERIDGGEDFANLAKELSQCPSKEVGGDLGFFKRGMMVPEFEEAAFRMQKDEVSFPVQTQFGYHIIRKTDERGGNKPSFDEAKELIRQILQHQKQNDVFLKKVEEFKQKYEVKKFL